MAILLVALNLRPPTTGTEAAQGFGRAREILAPIWDDPHVTKSCARFLLDISLRRIGQEEGGEMADSYLQKGCPTGPLAYVLVETCRYWEGHGACGFPSKRKAGSAWSG